MEAIAVRSRAFLHRVAGVPKARRHIVSRRGGSRRPVGRSPRLGAAPIQVAPPSLGRRSPKPMPDPTATGAGDSLGDFTRAGVPVWLDGLSRAHQSTGGLARLVKQRHVTGIAINATFFGKAPRADADC